MYNFVHRTVNQKYPCIVYFYRILRSIAARIIRTFRDFLNEDLCTCLYSVSSFKDLACQQAVMGDTPEHGLINFIDTKAKGRHLKKYWPVKGLCGRCLYIRLEIQSVLLVFSTQLCVQYCCPSSSLLSGSPPPPPVSATSCFTEDHTPPYLLLKLTDVLTDVITYVFTDV